MGPWVEILAFSLLALAIGPLLLLGLYLVADTLKIPFADRILGVMVPILSVQWFVGGVVNIVGGLAIAGLGVWAALHFSTLLHRISEAAMIAFGLWRAWRGVCVLQGFRNPDGPAS